MQDGHDRKNEKGNATIAIETKIFRSSFKSSPNRGNVALQTVRNFFEHATFIGKYQEPVNWSSLYVYAHKTSVRERLPLIPVAVNSELSSPHVLLLGTSRKMGRTENGGVSRFSDNHSLWLSLLLLIPPSTDRGPDWPGRTSHFKTGQFSSWYGIWVKIGVNFTVS